MVLSTSDSTLISPVDCTEPDSGGASPWGGKVLPRLVESDRQAPNLARQEPKLGAADQLS